MKSLILKSARARGLCSWSPDPSRELNAKSIETTCICMKILYKQCQFSDGLNYSIHPFYIIWLLKIIITLTSTILFDSFVGCIVRYVLCLYKK